LPDNCGVNSGKKITFVCIELFDEKEVFFKLFCIEGFECSSEQTKSEKRGVSGRGNNLAEFLAADRFVADET